MRNIVEFLHEIPNMCDILVIYLFSLILLTWFVVGLNLIANVFKLPALGKSFKLQLIQTEYVLRIIVMNFRNFHSFNSFPNCFSWKI
jgi:hypothetical protein